MLLIYFPLHVKCTGTFSNISTYLVLYQKKQKVQVKGTEENTKMKGIIYTVTSPSESTRRRSFKAMSLLQDMTKQESNNGSFSASGSGEDVAADKQVKVFLIQILGRCLHFFLF